MIDDEMFKYGPEPVLREAQIAAAREHRQGLLKVRDASLLAIAQSMSERLGQVFHAPGWVLIEKDKEGIYAQHVLGFEQRPSESLLGGDYYPLTWFGNGYLSSGSNDSLRLVRGATKCGDGRTYEEIADDVPTEQEKKTICEKFFGPTDGSGGGSIP